MRSLIILLSLFATTILTGCSGMTEMQEAYNYNTGTNQIHWISNYYAGDYYVGEYEIQNTHNGFCGDGYFCHKNDDKFRY